MFSFLTSRTTSNKPASNSNSFQHRNVNSTNLQQSNSSSSSFSNNLEGGYDDVTLEVENSNPSNSQSTLNNSTSRPVFSRELSSSGSFVGGGGGINQSLQSPQYPPVPEITRPSPTSGYPSLRSTFIRLENHLAETSPSLLDTLCAPILLNSPALLSLINTIAPYKLPQSVIEAYNLHDGQDPFASTTTGLIWGLWWMPLDLVEIEWKFWRKFEEAGGTGGMEDAFSASTENSRSRKSREEIGSYQFENDDDTSSSTRGRRDQSIEEIEDGTSGGGTGMNGMESFPRGWIRRKYSHPGWLPLLTDRAGNYVGVDLDPPPPPPASRSSPSKNAAASSSRIESEETEGYGQPGQVIAFGREIDEKVVLFPGDSVGGWGRFLSGFTDDVIRGEFSRLGGEVKRGKRTAWSNNNSNSNGEREGGSSDDDDWDEGDGIGESSYINGDRYGDEGESSGGSEENIWILRSEYRKWLSLNGEGGIVGALAERSRRKWRSVGVGLIKSPSLLPIEDPTTPTLSRSSPLSVVLPNLADIEPGPESGATERARSPNFFNENNSNSSSSSNNNVRENGVNSNQSTQNLQQQEGLEVTLSPPSPPKKFSHHQSSQNSISSNTSNNSNKSKDFLNDGRSDRRPNSNRPRTNRRPPPPAPMPLDLPTMSNLTNSLSSPNSSSSPSYNTNDTELRLSSDQPYRTSSPTLSSTSSNSRKLPPTSPLNNSISTSGSSNSKNSNSTSIALARSDSTMMLVEPDEGENLSLAGLGLDLDVNRSTSTNTTRRNGENDLMEVVVV